MTSCFGSIGNRLAALAFAAAVLTAATSLPAAAAALGSQMIVVKLDLAKVVRLPSQAQTLILGNPVIADVTLLRGGTTMVVTGKGYGQTNLIVLDKAGNLITESTIRVEQATDSLVIVQRGMDRESYSCLPRCQPAVELGDGVPFMTLWGSAVQARNGYAVPQTAVSK
ncbi:MAG: pilus assembly protein N-terminal domain-containing protein [Methylobacteriaceae bacterium]|nr:pilus assembly protein N-terminal domain-containing protein [Methylobacteriaceae bacterium]